MPGLAPDTVTRQGKADTEAELSHRLAKRSGAVAVPSIQVGVKCTLGVAKATPSRGPGMYLQAGPLHRTHVRAWPCATLIRCYRAWPSGGTRPWPKPYGLRLGPLPDAPMGGHRALSLG